MSPIKQTPEDYYQILKKFAPQKNLIFNPDLEVVMPLIEGLLINKERYGYPSCPCRLACNELAKDKDIICPCAYASPDIQEYGKCYCGLYVSRDFAAGKIQDIPVPERRPLDKQCF